MGFTDEYDYGTCSYDAWFPNGGINTEAQNLYWNCALGSPCLKLSLSIC